MKAMILKENCIVAENPSQFCHPDQPHKNYKEYYYKKNGNNNTNNSNNNLKLKSDPLELVEIPIPDIGFNDILIKVLACGVCRTELDQIEGRIVPPKLPIILGHQPVGIVIKIGKNVNKFKIGDFAGATWIFSSCGKCQFCKAGLENLCNEFKATGCHENGGYAEYMVINQSFAHKIPKKIINSKNNSKNSDKKDGKSDNHTNIDKLINIAPYMCSGVVGYRSLKLTEMENRKTLGLYGFGSAHHLVLQMANYLYPDSKKFVFTRNKKEQELALRLGANWVGNIKNKPPEKLDCAIDTTPVWKSVIFALENLQKGGRLVLNLIRKENIDKDFLLNLNYEKHLWLEKEIKSTANVTIKDGEEFLNLAAKIKIKPEITKYKLEDANKAIIDLKSGKSAGSKVIVM